ncbi:MAG: type II secretion system protein [Burkholderiales bacterium]|nr:type II secretion system protein [Burkholderiales bacterium]
MNTGCHRPAQRQAGFTLVEAIIVIVITGILAAVVAVFIRAPVEGYLDSVRRAELTDTADVALRRITRDVRLALPNSLRVTTTGGMNYIEFIMTSAGGRYRDPSDGSTGGNFLSFTNTGSTTFDVHGPMPAMNPTVDYIVVYNLGPNHTPTDTAADAYAPADPCTNCNRARISSFTGNTVTLVSNPFPTQVPPLPSPSGRFQVVPGATKAVTYSCPTAAAGNLTRYWNYGFNTAQPTGFASGSQALLAAGGVTCAVAYAPSVGGRSGLLEVQLTLTSGSGANAETVTLQHQIRVDNSP